jgi:hypothetical protein
MLAGAIAARYTGTTTGVWPTPSPMMNLPVEITAKLPLDSTKIPVPTIHRIHRRHVAQMQPIASQKKKALFSVRPLMKRA